MSTYKIKSLFFVLSVVFSHVIMCEAATEAAKVAEISVTSRSSIDEIRAELAGLDIPVLEFKMKDSQFPTCGYVEAPVGCNGFSIIDNNYVEGRLAISIKGNTLYDSGEYKSKLSGVRVKLRGNTSSYSNVSKKSYKVKLSKKADLLLRDGSDGKDKDWVLLGFGSKKINCVAGAQTARACGVSWQPEGRHVAVVMNDKYMGTYYLVEAVSAGKHRVDIDDSGYIAENDAYWWKPGETYFKTVHQQFDLGWTLKEPDSDDFHEMTLENIKFLLNTAEHQLYTEGEAADMLDYDSFARWMLAHDIMNTLDGYGSNMFVVKKDFSPYEPFATKLQMGPLWDFDTSYEAKTKAHAAIASLPGFW